VDRLVLGSLAAVEDTYTVTCRGSVVQYPD
jgi:hypothetical protein